MREIKDNDKLYAVVISADDVPGGTRWYGAESSAIQACSWAWSAGKVFRAHYHLYRPRTILATEEALVVVSGKIRCTVVMDTKTESFTLNAGDCVVHYSGGHGYKIIEDAVAYEFKTGAKAVNEKDKEYYDTSVSADVDGQGAESISGTV